jgi:hypothetical protein
MNFATSKNLIVKSSMFPHCNIHNYICGTGAHPASYLLGRRSSFPAGKTAGGEADLLHLVPRSRMRGAMPPLPQYVIMAWCSVKAQGQIYLYFLLVGKHNYIDHVSIYKSRHSITVYVLTVILTIKLDRDCQ